MNRLAASGRPGTVQRVVGTALEPKRRSYAGDGNSAGNKRQRPVAGKRRNLRMGARDLEMRRVDARLQAYAEQNGERANSEETNQKPSHCCCTPHTPVDKPCTVSTDKEKIDASAAVCVPVPVLDVLTQVPAMALAIVVATAKLLVNSVAPLHT